GEVPRSVRALDGQPHRAFNSLTGMTSRLLASLDERIARASDPLEDACLRAERASLLARQGHLDLARAELAALHARFDQNPSVVVSAWVSVAEGLVMYFSNLGGLARDKMLRALALSTAAQVCELEALGAAWLAQMDFAHMDLDRMTRNVVLALQRAAPDHHSARSRACLVAAQAYHWAERLDLSLPWYARARQHATSEGDEAMLSALMHNMAWMRAAAARRLSVCGVLDQESVRQAQAGADSVNHFDCLVGTASLSSLVPILRGQVLVLCGRYKEALLVFDEYIPMSVTDGLSRMMCSIFADVAWCRIKTGDTAGARKSALVALESINAETQIDDRAMTHSRLAQVYATLGDSDTADDHRRLGRDDWRVHSQRQLDLVETLNRSLEKNSP
ncbi:MAG: hypothetical protein OEL91_06405, partial [Burkholderiaceae bacterium]|nr:hypothetical protein [Burkholderiaceae bacterium]